MADAFEVKIDTKKLEQAIRKVPRELHKSLAQAFTQSLVEFEGEMVLSMDQRATPPWFSNSGLNLQWRSGNLAGSLGINVKPGARLSDLRGVGFIGDAKTPYAGTQEAGATITGSPWLTIPLPDNYTASGVARYQSAAALRDDPSVKTWIQRSKAGNLIIRAQFEDDGPIKNLWMLKRQVTIPPRLKFAKTFRAQRPRQIKLINSKVDKALLDSTRGAR